MDPISQAVVGATLTQAVTEKKNSQIIACLAGALAGMAADIDVLFRSQTDPLMFLEFHRQFTHSFLFIPVGGLLCALLLYPFLKKKISFARLFLFSCLGYGTHGLLDACTSYGTQLFWPFSDVRIAWDIISVVDPLFTLPVLILILLGAVKNKRFFARAALMYLVCYLFLGQIQHNRALIAVANIANERGHITERITVKPTFGNLLMWKLIYEHDGFYYVDAVRLGIEPVYFPGESLAKLSPVSTSELSPVQSRDVERFRWFSDGYIALSPDDHSLIGDIRYSMLPNSIDPLWAIRLNPKQPEQHVDYVVLRKLSAEKRSALLAMLFE
ncbi:MAG: metal-dependent hydrolase [Gammaproteobacteria bacterium]|nr:metal-dependent hydrolase [Gammaproteobacteria bacterium]